MGYILFSPIGKTDPITECYDGSMLHICRVYKPKMVYLYISKEMLEYHHLDDRYRNAIRYLAKKENIEIKIETIECPALEKVQIFDAFYNEFEPILQKIQEEQVNDGDKILLNVSSGTPAMKSALQFLAITNINYLPIQVVTPQKGANRNKPEFYNYDFAMEWELNEDNKSDFVNRCHESDVRNLNLRMKKEIIFKHLDTYDYQGALNVADTVKELMDDKTYFLLQGAAKRAALNEKCDDDFRRAQMDVLPVKSSDKRKIFEYLLILQIKEQRKEYADFLRGVTPVIFVLFKNVLKERGKFDVEKYCSKKGNGALELKREKLAENGEEGILRDLDNEFKNGGFKDSELTSKALSVIIKSKFEDKEPGIADMTDDLRKVETNARNIAAHNIVSVTDEWIKKKTKLLPAQIMDKLIKYAMMAGITNNKDDWNSYDEMNACIKQSMI